MPKLEMIVSRSLVKTSGCRASMRVVQLRREAVVSRPARRMLRSWERSSIGSRVTSRRASRKT